MDSKRETAGRQVTQPEDEHPTSADPTDGKTKKQESKTQGLKATLLSGPIKPRYYRASVGRLSIAHLNHHLSQLSDFNV